jgi:uncharacterized protein
LTKSNQLALDRKPDRKSNRLAHESSPYLLQHAHNPVDWYPWSNEALERAIKEDKPIFLSIGYSSCHWCHVMAHESFENEHIASIMNENYVNIKLDREERPDIDDIYQRACQLTSGTGGWPLSVFMTPSQKPFYVGTYFPATGRHGLPGFATVLTSLAEAYRKKRDQVLSSTEEFMQALKNSSVDIIQTESEKLEKTILDEAAVSLLQMGDYVYGGFGQAPKFPNPSNLLFLLRAFNLSGISNYRDFVILTANKMSEGGIYDHVGGGFARYSTDQKWLIPHFEKMLYDNAQLATVYSELFQLTKDSRYLNTVNGILQYVSNEMTSNLGGFFSAQDADSEGEEGKFYVWSYSEIKDIVESEIFEPFCRYFGVSEGGNFEGKNILNIQTSIGLLSRKYGYTDDVLASRIRKSLEKLQVNRSERPRPGRDDKILTSWNGLMISGFLDGYKVTGNIKYLNAAKRAFEFIESNLTYSQVRLHRAYKNANSKISGYLDDYTFYLKAILDLFSVESKPHYLKRALDYMYSTIEHFWDNSLGDFFFTSDDQEKLILRTKNHYDLAIPSGNSVAASNLLRLYYYTQEQDFLTKATRLLKLSSKAASENPFGFGQLLCAIYFEIKRPTEISIIKRKAMSTSPLHVDMINWISRQFIPNSITAIIEEGSDYHELQKYSFFKGKDLSQLSVQVPQIAYICKNYSCSLPISSVKDFENQLQLAKSYK